MTSLRIAAMLGLLALAACSGSSGNALGFPGTGNPSFTQCNPGTDVQLARPAPNQSGAGSVSSIEIVANGSSNVLNQSPQSWNLQVTDNIGNQYLSGPLNLTSDAGGPHPYGSDYFYSAPIQTLPVGFTYNVSLVQSGGCSAYPLYPYGTFST